MTGWDTKIKKSLGACGTNVFIGKYCTITNPSQVFLGDNVRIDPYVLITTSLKTGNFVQVCSHAVLGGGSSRTITLGSWSWIGYGSQLFTSSEDYSGEWGPVNNYWGKNKTYDGDIEFKDYSGVASSVIVMPGVVLPRGVAIGAMSFVYSSKNLDPWTVYVGNPLVRHKSRNRDKVIKLSTDPGWLKKHDI